MAVKRYAAKQFISNNYELCNLVVVIIAWKCERWFTKDLAKKYIGVVLSFDNVGQSRTTIYFKVSLYKLFEEILFA